MKLLVTGGAGFIGSNFILYWMKHHPEDRLVNLDALTYAGNLENVKAVEKNKNYTFIHGDIRKPQDVDRALAGVETVVHFAAESHVDRSITGPKVFLETNVLGTQVLLDASLKNGVKRFHHVSTDEVFGALKLKTQAKFNETTAYDPSSPYSASKAASDHLVRAYHRTYGLPITISNCSNNFGPRQFPEKLISLAITNLLEGKKVPVYGDGLYVRDWLYVDDHARAIDLILQGGRVGETYCVGGMTSDVNNITIVKKLLNIFGKGDDQIEYVKDRPGHDRRYAIDWTKIQKELSYAPAHDFDEYLHLTADWYRKQEAWWKKLKRP